MVAQAAPTIPQAGMAVSVQPSTTFTPAEITMFTTGIAVCPSPCKTPVVT